ncbi:MAG TPA: hypothetical protein VM686_06115, partial [Polyangiaceae bacterium]|nr:hypothetical protein [Polyangiaceae bacterium]
MTISIEKWVSVGLVCAASVAGYSSAGDEPTATATESAPGLVSNGRWSNGIWHNGFWTNGFW